MSCALGLPCWVIARTELHSRAGPGCGSAGFARVASTQCRTDWPARPRPTCCSTRTTRSTGCRGARRPWSSAAERNVPILLSIGYSACHWCHVMERESFEDEADGRPHERALRVHQARPRGASRPRRDLHGGVPGDDRRRRLAAQRLPDARAGALLRRHVLPARGAPRDGQLAPGAGGGGRRMGGARGRDPRPRAERIADRLAGAATAAARPRSR